MTRLRTLAAATALAITTITPAMAQQYGYDAQCRALPAPGYMMLPPPPSQACLQQRAEAARVAAAQAARQRQMAAQAAEAERQRQAAQAATNKPADHPAAEPPPSTSSDPYGFEEKKKAFHRALSEDYAEHWRNHLRSMALMGQAVQCKVISDWVMTNEDYFGTYYQSMFQSGLRDMGSIMGTIKTQPAQSERNAFENKAFKEGKEAGSVPGGCDIFTKDPDWAFKLHTLAEHRQWLPY